MAQEEYKMLSEQLFTYKRMVYTIDDRLEQTTEYLDSLETFNVRDDDVFVITFPKSGTVWTQRIVTLLYEDDFPEQSDNTTFDRMPWLEFKHKQHDYNTRPSPRLFCSHLHQHLVPLQLQQRGKIIYVIRNPKDIVVSYFHFVQFMKRLEYVDTYNEMMEKFFSGWMVGGCWFDHVRGWYTNKDKYNILFLTYEEMIKDLRAAVVRISQFVGKNLSDAAIDRVVEQATFKNMKKDPKANYEGMHEDDADASKGTFLRKGTVGDWKNFLTVAQNEHFDRGFRERMKDVPIEFVWDINDLHG